MNNRLPRGIFLLSIDTELAWGTVHHGQFRRPVAQHQVTREVISRLLGLLEEFEIRATWALVGHLFLSECHAVEHVKHPEIIRPTYRWFPEEWFSADPCAHLDVAPSWYGADVIQQILSCQVPQEIGCHTFSHVIVGDPGCSRECLQSELRACRLEAERLGVALQSFVFPRNSVGHLDVLKEAGFAAYRGPAPNWFGHLPGAARKVGHFLDHLLMLPPPMAVPGQEDGLWNLPASYFYPGAAGWWRLIPPAFRLRRVRQGLREATAKSGVFHMWFHPSNLATASESLLRTLERVFVEVRRYREEGLLWNPTMGELALALESRLHLEKIPT